MGDIRSKKLSELVGDANALAVIAGSTDDYIELSRVALVMALTARANTSVSSVPPLSDGARRDWGELLNGFKDNNAVHKTTLSIHNDRHDAKEVRYEKDDEHLTITIISSGEPIKQSDITVSKNDSGVQVMFCLSPTAREHAGIYSKDILKNHNIDIGDTEKCVSITPGDKTVSEKVYEIISVLTPNALSIERVATILFASLITETKNFTSKVSEGALNVGAALLEHGADKNLVQHIASEHKKDTPSQLIGRALARMSDHAELSSTWTFLSQDDFKKTGREPNDETARVIISAIREQCATQPTVIVLYESHSSVRVAIDGAQKIKIPTGPFKNFSEAERAIRDTLK